MNKKELSLILMLLFGCANKQSSLEYVANQFDKSRVVAIGESNHYSNKQRKFVKDLIPTLKKKGVSHYATELLSESKESIDKYFESNKQYRDSTINSLLSWGPSLDYLNLAYEFHKNGISVVPIDKKVKRTWDKRRGISKDTLYVENVRDKHMAEELMKILEKNPKAKILTYTGAFHTTEKHITENLTDLHVKFKYPPFASLLKDEHGIDPFTIYLMEGKWSKKEFQSPFGSEKDGFKDAPFPNMSRSHYKFREINDGYVNLNPKISQNRKYKLSQKKIPKR